jgi:Ankyrin repeats (3 copies)/Ankyrin repeats (many copies)
MKGHVDIVQQLLNAEANVSLVAAEGSTALHSAAHAGFQDVVEILLNSKFDPFAQDRDGRTALHCAVSNGHLLVVEKLLGYDTLPFVKDHDGQTALHFASQTGRENVVRRVLNVPDVDPSIQDNHGNSPLHFVAMGGHIKVVTMLLEAGASVNITNILGLTPLYVAAYFNQPSIVTKLLNAIGIDCASDWYDEVASAGDQISSATTCLEFLTTKFTEDCVLLNNLGERFYLKGEYEKAAVTFDKIVALDQTNLNAMQISDIAHSLYTCYACKTTPIYGYLHMCSVCDLAFCQICADDPENEHRNHGLFAIPSQHWISKHLSPHEGINVNTIPDESLDEATVDLQTTRLQASTEDNTGLTTD